MKESPSYKTPLLKKVAFVLFRFMVRVGTGRTIMDPTTGLQGLSRRAFLYYSKYSHFDDLYPDANMLTQMLLLGFRVREVPALMHSRTSGSSMHSGLKPALYMFRMFFSILGIQFRYRVLKTDAGICNEEK